MRLAWVHFRLEMIPGLSIFARYRPPWEIPAPPEAAREFLRIFDLHKQANPAGSLEIIGILAKIVSGFMPHNWDTVFPHPDKFEILRPAMEKTAGRISTNRSVLKSLAKTVSLHPVYFSNLFKETFGMSPRQFYQQQRMVRAKMLLPSGLHPADFGNRRRLRLSRPAALLPRLQKGNRILPHRIPQPHRLSRPIGDCRLAEAEVIKNNKKYLNRILLKKTQYAL